MAAACTFSPIRADAQEPAPALEAAAGGRYVLTLPYLEAGVGLGRQAFTLGLESTDLANWRIRAGTLSTAAVTTFPAYTPATVAAGATGGFVLSLPYFEFVAGGVRKAYAVDLASTDLSLFTVRATSVREVALRRSITAPTQLAVATTNLQTVGGRAIASSTQLALSWQAPAGTDVHHYEATAIDAVQGTVVQGSSTLPALTLRELKAATLYRIAVKSCSDAACSGSGVSTAVEGTTAAEHWQLQGSGNTTTGLTRIVSDGNVRISATRFGADAGGTNAGRVQLYYGPTGTTSPRQALITALTSAPASAATASTYLSFTSTGPTTGLISPATASTPVKTIATGQGVPLSTAMGARVRLFFEATGADGKTRIYWLDSQDGYTGQDFNAGAASTCANAADYDSGGGCAPQLAIGIAGDSVGANAKLPAARQHKVGVATQTDWRWDGAAGTFMVFTTDAISGCSSSNMNHGYAVWSGSRWDVQYAANGCPKLFTSAQAAFPMHVGGARYKLYYGDPSATTGKISASSMPFLGPKKLIYADGALTGAAQNVDFEDWEAQTQARDVVFLWPNGDLMDATAEGYIDDYHFLAPTGSLDLQVMYLAITNGSEIPFAAAARLLNP